MSLLPERAFHKMLDTIKSQGVFWAFYSSEKNNPSDRWMAMAAEYLFHVNHVPYAVLRVESLPDMFGGVIFSGGSSIGTERTCCTGVRRKLLDKIRHRGLRCVVLPQTIVPPLNDKFPNNTVFFARDSHTLEAMKTTGKSYNCILSTELTLGWPLDAKTYNNVAERKLGLWLRHDGLGRFPYVDGSMDPASLVEKATDYLYLAGRCEVNITDRLHFAVASLLRKRKTIMLPISFKENYFVYVSWLHDLGCKWADTIDEAVAISNKE